MEVQQLQKLIQCYGPIAICYGYSAECAHLLRLVVNRHARGTPGAISWHPGENPDSYIILVGMKDHTMERLEGENVGTRNTYWKGNQRVAFHLQHLRPKQSPSFVLTQIIILNALWPATPVPFPLPVYIVLLLLRPSRRYAFNYFDGDIWYCICKAKQPFRYLKNILFTLPTGECTPFIPANTGYRVNSCAHVRRKSTFDCFSARLFSQTNAPLLSSESAPYVSLVHSPTWKVKTKTKQERKRRRHQHFMVHEVRFAIIIRFSEGGYDGDLRNVTSLT